MLVPTQPVPALASTLSGFQRLQVIQLCLLPALNLILPLCPALPHPTGKFFLVQFPQFSTLLLPLEPLIRLCECARADCFVQRL